MKTYGNGARSAVEKLKELADRKAAIAERIARIESQLAAQSRKDDTRLKILIGAAFLADLDKHNAQRAYIEATLRRAITKDKDRDFLKARGWLQEPVTPPLQPLK